MNDPERWAIAYHKDLEKEIRRLPRPTIRRILEAIESLAINPWPPGCRKMEGHQQLWRIQIGVYRIIYQIDEDKRLITSYRIGHRRDVYRNL